MTELVVVMGLSGADRSKIAREYAEKIGGMVLSKSIVAQTFPSLKPERAATVLTKKIQRRLKHELNVVFEDDCFAAKRRIGLIKHLAQARIECRKTCVLVLSKPTPTRAHELLSFCAPWYSEGWDEIVVLPRIDLETSFEWSQDLLAQMREFNQFNSHHELTLGAHCDKACEAAKEDGAPSIEVLAARWHDIGKLWTQEKDEEGEAHYFGHAGVGAYMWLCGYPAQSLFGRKNPDDTKNALWAAVVISLHMLPYQSDWRECLESRKYDKELIAAIGRIHDFDLRAH